MATKNVIANTTEQEVIVVTVNANTERQGYEVRFSGYPKASVKNVLKELKFQFYGTLGNAWIKKQAKVTEDGMKKFVQTCTKNGYTVESTTDGKADMWISKYFSNAKTSKKSEKPAKTVSTNTTVSANNEAVINAMIGLLTQCGFTVTKAEEPKVEKPKAESKPKTTKKPKTESKPKAAKETPKTDAKTEIGKAMDAWNIQKEPEAKAEKPKEEPKTEPKLTASATPVSNNKKNPKADKKLFVNGKEIARVF